MVGKGLEISIIGELLMYASSSLVPLAMPLAILLSSLMTFGSMGEYYELTAVKSSGISLHRILLPLVILVMLFSTGTFFFANNVLPYTNLKMKSLLYDVRQQRPEVQIVPGVFYNGLDNYSIRVERKDPVTNLLYDVKIYDHTAHRGNIKVTVADSGQMKMTTDRRNMLITLWNGCTYYERDEGKKKKKEEYFPHETDKFGEQRIIIEMTGFELSRSDLSIWKNSYQMLNVTQLDRAIDSMHFDMKRRAHTFNQLLLSRYYFRRTPPFQNSYGALHLQSPMITVPGPLPELVEKKPVSTYAHISREQSLALHRKAVKQKPNPVSKRSQAIDKDTVKAKPIIKVVHFDSLYSSLPLEGRKAIMNSATNKISSIQMLINNSESSIEEAMKYLRRHEIEWHRKFSLAFACLIFLFVGAPLGAIIRKGGLGMPTVISTLLFILYYIISMTGEKFVRESILTGFQGMWLSTFLLLIAGLFLTYQATNDSAFLNLDTYMNWFREKAGLRRGIILERKAHITGKFELIEMPLHDLQNGFLQISQMADDCVARLKKDMGFLRVLNMALRNQGLPYLAEFGVHYNAFIDQLLLTKWFRISYFQKRIAEFPFMRGRLHEPVFLNPFLQWTLIVVVPFLIARMLQIYFKSNRIRRNLSRVKELSAGMINLTNRAAMRIENDPL